MCRLEEELTPKQREIAINLMRRMFKTTVEQVDGQYSDAREVYHAHQKRKNVLAATQRRALIKSMMKFADVVIIKTLAD